MPIDPFAAGLAGAILFAAYLVRGIVGFGSGLIAVPLLALQFPLPAVVPIVVLLDYLGSAFQGAHNHRLVAWREQLPLIPFMIVGVALGMVLLHAAAPKLLAQTLGVFVILYAIYQLLPVPALRGSRLLVVPSGFLGGLIGTLFGTGGPFYVIYFGLRQLDPNVQRATTAVNFLIDGGIRLAAFASVGAFGRDTLLALAGAVPVAGMGLWLGGRIHSTVSRRTYVRIISLVLVASGVTLLIKD